MIIMQSLCIGCVIVRHICIGLFIVFLFSGCASTTALTSTVQRKQLMLVSENIWNHQAADAYQSTLKKAKNKKLLVSDAKLTAILSKLTPYTAGYNPAAASWDWQINAQLNGNLNAHGFAGGKILLNTGLYWTLNLSEDELAFVIAHEMAHALRQHSREKISASLSFGSLPSYLSEGVSQMWLHEREADIIAMELMKQAGFNHQSAMTFWQKLEHETRRRRAIHSNQPLMNESFLKYRRESIEQYLV